MQVFGRGERERHELGGTFPCPGCGDLRAYDEVTVRPCLRVFGLPLRRGRAIRSMRCRTCGSGYERLIDGELNARQVAAWDHRVARLVATVGVAAGGGSDAHCAAARSFLLGRGWFTAEVDGVVGWASEVSSDATNGFVDELVTALEALSTMTRPGGMERVISDLADVLAAGGSTDAASSAILDRCAEAAAVERTPVEKPRGSSRGKRSAVAA